MVCATDTHSEIGDTSRLPRILVETQGLEPWTPCLQSRCSSQLSYVPINCNELFYSTLSVTFNQVVYWVYEL